MTMQPWKPDADPRQARRIGKTTEEAGELIAVLARIAIQGLDAIDPSSGKSNRQRLEEEMADLYAQMELTMDYLALDRPRMSARACEKRRQMNAWEAHFTKGEQS